MSTTPARGVTPGLPTNTGSFKATERPEADIALAAPTSQPKPYLVTIQPQAWINDYATDSEPAVSFDIAPILADMTPEKRAEFLDEAAKVSPDFDWLYEEAADRGLVKSGYGPFHVFVNHAMTEGYLQETYPAEHPIVCDGCDESFPFDQVNDEGLCATCAVSDEDAVTAWTMAGQVLRGYIVNPDGDLASEFDPAFVIAEANDRFHEREDSDEEEFVEGCPDCRDVNSIIEDEDGYNRCTNCGWRDN